jgi:dTDP-4-dehydrorhamnose 3,5-epimerase
MGYVSITLPGVVRGPHEHVSQADCFCFLGTSPFKVFLWDARKDSETFMHKQVVDAQEEKPTTLIVPPGVVHAYKNVGKVPGLVLNFPNRLFKGKGKQLPVDEIRHEEDPNTIFRLE